MMNRKPVVVILYILCLYDIYLYLPDTLGLFNVNFYPPDPDVLTYFDAVMLLVGGIVTGMMLLKIGGRFNKWLGVITILLNVVLTPLFLFKAIP